MAKYISEAELNGISNNIIYNVNKILAAGYDVENLTETEAQKIFDKLSIALSKILDVRNIVL